jgi:hypothetical protein
VAAGIYFLYISLNSLDPRAAFSVPFRALNSDATAYYMA